MEPRTPLQRKADALDKLRTEIDCWVASASAAGEAYLIPLSFYWDGARLTLATPRKSRTARNLCRSGFVRIAIGPPRDLVIVEGDVVCIAKTEVDDSLVAAHATATGFNPQQLPEEYIYIQVTPRRIQTWREANELAECTVMEHGRWLI